MSAPAKGPKPMAAGTPFGKYELLDCIAESVMSKVYRARLRLGKMNRIIIVKTLHPRYLTDQKSRDQFYHEIETTMALDHPNIVQIHDFGEEDGCPFIVMEWVHGRNFRDLTMAAITRTGRGVPPLIACYLIDQCAQGLNHAHSLKDKLTGESFNIVHRDLSPHNVIVGFDGTVKLIDFGIARIAHGDSDTLSDQIWGKAGYFSPEQAHGDRLDRRSDIFALGAVFFELLSGRKLFKGENMVAGLYKIRTADTFVPKMLERLKGLPPGLAEVLIKSMRVNREERYSTAEQFSKDIRKYIRAQAKLVDARSVSQFLQQLFPDELEKDRAKLRELAAELKTTIEAPAPGPAPAPTDSSKTPGQDFYSSVVPFPDSSQTFPAASSGSSAPVRKPPPNENSGNERPVTPLIFARTMPEPTTDSTHGTSRGLELEKTEFTGTGGTGKLRLTKQWLIVANVIAVLAGLFALYKLSRPASDPVEPPKPAPSLATAPIKPPPATSTPTAAPIRIRFHMVPELNARTTLLLNGKAVKVSDGYLPPVASGEAHRLEIRRSGYITQVKEIGASQSEDIELVPVNSGSLSLTLRPAATAKVTRGDGELWVKKGSSILFRLPPGRYRVYLSTEDGRERTIEVKIEQGVTTLASEYL